MAPHIDFGKAGPNGSIDWNPNDVLLTATDKSKHSYNEAIQKGLAAPNETQDPFHWCYVQHNVQIVPTNDGNLHILVFNNEAGMILEGENHINQIPEPHMQDERRANDLITYGKHIAKNILKLEQPLSLMTEYVINEQEKTVYEYNSYEQDRFSAACSGASIGEKTRNYMMFGTGVCSDRGSFSEFNRAGTLLLDATIYSKASFLYRANKYPSLY